jgi:hypothetical protein
LLKGEHLGFFSSLFGGSNSTLSGAINQFGQIAGQQTAAGQGYENQAGTFWSDILSGNSAKQSKALSPEISAASERTNQGIKTSAEFGTRSGGTTAKNASAQDTLRGDITKLTGSLMSGSASSLGNLGQNMMSTGIGALGNQVDASQMQMQNWSNSILGLGITKAAGAGIGSAISEF